ncbi:MAG: PDDEXK nuclease domain-containing protein [Cyclobacteriaceae bacterium]|nr:PDDEXK nuclease domain-containing protein [Cyclobacteriaceae bacterium]
MPKSGKWLIGKLKSKELEMSSELDKNYGQILQHLKEKIKQARLRASVVVNAQMLQVYWEIGQTILEQQKKLGWGAKIIDRLAADLKIEFGDMKGLSVRNLKYMRAFAEAYPQFMQPLVAQLQSTDNQSAEIVQVEPAQFVNQSINEIVQVPLAQLTWYHHTTLLDKVKEPEVRVFYIQKAVENGWTRDMLVNQIESGLYKRQGALIHNFKQTLPDYQTDLAQQLFKDPYQFDFLMLGAAARERDLENAIINHITKVLIELGDGFAFMGRQYRLEAGGQEYFLDLLFYHTKLRRYVVIDLKIGDFLPEYAGKMNFYLGVADDKLKGPMDEASIGLILCKTKNKIIAEYALRDTSKPIGIAEYRINERLPEDIKGELPSIEELEQKLDKEIQENISEVERRLKLVKEKVKAMQTEELQTPATYQLLQDIFDKSLKPLFQQIMTKLSTDFSAEFMTHRAMWQLKDTLVYGIDGVEDFWRKEENLKGVNEIEFQYQLRGLKKIGTENVDVHVPLKLIIHTYWYGFSMLNHNDHQPFLKKMYHQQIATEEIQSISDLLVGKVLDRIEWAIEDFETKKRKK